MNHENMNGDWDHGWPAGNPPPPHHLQHQPPPPPLQQNQQNQQNQHQQWYPQMYSYPYPQHQMQSYDPRAFQPPQNLPQPMVVIPTPPKAYAANYQYSGPLPSPPQYHAQQAYQSPQFSSSPPPRPAPPAINSQRPMSHQSHQPKTVHPAQLQKPVSQPAPRKTLLTPSATISKQTPVASTSHPEYRLLLLGLADQYLAEARAISRNVVRSEDDDAEENYDKLLLMAFRCYRTLLEKKQWKLSPRLEASIQLQYANLLFEETTNLDQVDTMLSKGMLFCEQNRLTDLKYCMQHSYIRVLLASNLRAAMKYLEQVINDVTTCQHVHWIYAFRLLRVLLCLQNSSNVSMSLAQKDISALLDQTRANRDHALRAFVGILEAILHLQSRSVDAVKEVERSLSTVRGEMNAVDMTGLPQLSVFCRMLSLASNLDPFQPEQSKSDMQTMQQLFDDLPWDESWKVDGSFAIPLKSGQDQMHLANTGFGVFSKGLGGNQVGLVFNWLPKEDAFALGYLLSGLAIHTKNNTNGHKTEELLAEGLKGLDNNDPKSSKSNVALSTLTSQLEFRYRLRITIHCYLAFIQANRSAWDLALSNLDTVDQLSKSSPQILLSSNTTQLITYIRAISHHGRGDLIPALQLYQSPALALPEHPLRYSNQQETLAILSAMNTLMIIRSPSHPQHFPLNHSLLSKLASYFSRPSSNPTNINATNPSLISAFHLLHAIQARDTESRITDLKQHLHSAIQPATRAGNTLLQSLVLAHMYYFFFTGTIGQQTEKAARGARATANEAGNRLWTCIGDDTLGKVMASMGEAKAATDWEQRAQWCAKDLPQGVKDGLGLEVQAPQQQYYQGDEMGPGQYMYQHMPQMGGDVYMKTEDAYGRGSF